VAHAFHKSPHVAGCTAADLVAEVGRRKNRVRAAKERLVGLWNYRAVKAAQRSWLVNVAKTAAAKAKTRSMVQTATASPNVDPEVAPAVPEGRKTLRVFN
jgi:hypothetical protein